MCGFDGLQIYSCTSISFVSQKAGQNNAWARWQGAQTMCKVGRQKKAETRNTALYKPETAFWFKSEYAEFYENTANNRRTTTIILYE